MSITINNLGATPDTTLVLEKTLVKDEYVLVDTAKRHLPTGFSRVKITSDIKNGILRGLCQGKLYYNKTVNGVVVEKYVTIGFTLTGDAEDIRAAEMARCLVGPGTGCVINNVSGAIWTGTQVVTALASGVGVKPNVNAQVFTGGAYDSEGDGTGLTHTDLTTRMKNPFVRASMSLEMIPDGSSVNGVAQGVTEKWSLAAAVPA